MDIFIFANLASAESWPLISALNGHFTQPPGRLIDIPLLWLGQKCVNLRRIYYYYNHKLIRSYRSESNSSGWIKPSPLESISTNHSGNSFPASIIMLGLAFSKADTASSRLIWPSESRSKLLKYWAVAWKILCKGPSTHGEEFANEGSTNTRRRIFLPRVFAGEEFWALNLIKLTFFAKL